MICESGSFDARGASVDCFLCDEVIRSVRHAVGGLWDFARVFVVAVHDLFCSVVENIYVRDVTSHISDEDDVVGNSHDRVYAA